MAGNRIQVPAAVAIWAAADVRRFAFRFEGRGVQLRVGEYGEGPATDRLLDLYEFDGAAIFWKGVRPNSGGQLRKIVGRCRGCVLREHLEIFIVQFLRD